MQFNKIIIAATLAVTAIISPAAAAADTRSATDQNSQLTQAKFLTQEIMSGNRSQKSLTPSQRSLLKQYTTPGEMRVTRTPSSLPVKAALLDLECVDPVLQLAGVDQRPQDVVVEVPEP